MDYPEDLDHSYGTRLCEVLYEASEAEALTRVAEYIQTWARDEVIAAVHYLHERLPAVPS